ncbi:MAG: hypothetical protein AB1411_01555 [Nitrospirota bacterium]|jgi:hypothetical protein
MASERPRSETLVLEALPSGSVITMEQLSRQLPQLSWNEIFHAVDALSRQGVVLLRKRGFEYELLVCRQVGARRVEQLHSSGA